MAEEEEVEYIEVEEEEEEEILDVTETTREDGSILIESKVRKADGTIVLRKTVRRKKKKKKKPKKKFGGGLRKTNVTGGFAGVPQDTDEDGTPPWMKTKLKSTMSPREGGDEDSDDEEGTPAFGVGMLKSRKRDSGGDAKGGAGEELEFQKLVKKKPTKEDGLSIDERLKLKKQQEEDQSNQPNFLNALSPRKDIPEKSTSPREDEPTPEFLKVGLKKRSVPKDDGPASPKGDEPEPEFLKVGLKKREGGVKMPEKNESDEPKTVDFRASLRKGGDRQSSAFKPAQDDDPEAAAKAAESARKAEERRQARIKKEREEQERKEKEKAQQDSALRNAKATLQGEVDALKKEKEALTEEVASLKKEIKALRKKKKKAAAE